MTSAQQDYDTYQLKYVKGPYLGQGSFGKVFLAKSKAMPSNNQNQDLSNHSIQNQFDKSQLKHQFYALKKLKPLPTKKYGSEQKTIENYPEVKTMQAVKHKNLMQLLDIVCENKGYEKHHYLIMDYGIDLIEFFKHKQLSLSPEQIKHIFREIAFALKEMHNKQYIHRDIKPSNIFVMKDGTIKLADFSISRPLTGPQPHEKESEIQNQMTPNITTRYYRAPQIIYGSRNYNQSIDIWGFGCTIAELILHQPIFPGTSDIMQLQLIFSTLGYPQDQWPEAQQYPYYLEFSNQEPPKGLENILPNADKLLLELLNSMLTLNPSKRPTIQQILLHPFLASVNSQAERQFKKIALYLHEKKEKQFQNYNFV